VADGLALAARLKGETSVAATFTGDGATSEGDFHEAMNLCRGVEAAGPVRDREQPVRPSTPAAEQ
jgi:deoxyxylulose-5-phosphate synthase